MNCMGNHYSVVYVESGFMYPSTLDVNTDHMVSIDSKRFHSHDSLKSK